MNNIKKMIMLIGVVAVFSTSFAEETKDPIVTKTETAVKKATDNTKKVAKKTGKAVKKTTKKAVNGTKKAIEKK